MNRFPLPRPDLVYSFPTASATFLDAAGTQPSESVPGANTYVWSTDPVLIATATSAPSPAANITGPRYSLYPG